MSSSRSLPAPVSPGPSRRARTRTGAKPVGKAALETVDGRVRAAAGVAYPGLLGMTKFTREVKGAVERASSERVEVSFGTSSNVPQIRFRPVSLHPDVAKEVPEANRIPIKAVRVDGFQYRALVLTGTTFVVSSGVHSVIMDRHPDCPSDVLDAHLKARRAEIRSGAHASTRKHARRAADAGEMALLCIRRIGAEQANRDADLAGVSEQIVDLLERVLASGVLSAEDKKLLARLRIREGADATLADNRRPNSWNLDRTEVD